MPKAKQEIALSFKISHAMKAALEREMKAENRSQSDMAKVLLAESLKSREAKRTIHEIL